MQSHMLGESVVSVVPHPLLLPETNQSKGERQLGGVTSFAGGPCTALLHAKWSSVDGDPDAISK